jgi:hypothetical protein
MRESPALKLIELIEARGASAAYHDPHIPEIRPTRKHGGLTARKSQTLSAEALAAFDAVLIATDHDDVDYGLSSATPSSWWIPAMPARGMDLRPRPSSRPDTTMNSAEPTYDLAVIGGGINGCGIARDAAGRGASVVLFEKDDLASATSSASTKLIHGGCAISSTTSSGWCARP